MLTTNYQDLSFKLGGILNKSIVRIPFQRDIKLKEKEEINTLLSTYSRICQNGDIIITTSESILSLKLKFLECCYNDNRHEISNLMKEIDARARDIIDESDEILSFKKQLIYTIGTQFRSRSHVASNLGVMILDQM